MISSELLKNGIGNTTGGGPNNIDSSMDMDQYSMTDSSSYISDQSSFSIDSKDNRSCSNDLRKSFDSQSNDYLYSSSYVSY